VYVCVYCLCCVYLKVKEYFVSDINESVCACSHTPSTLANMRVQTVSQQHGDCTGCGFCTERRKRIARIVAGGCRQHSAGESIHVGEGVASAPPAASRSSRTEYRSEHDVSRRHGQDTSTDVRQQLLHGLHLLQSLHSQVHVHMDTKPHAAICIAMLDYIITFFFRSSHM